MMVFRHIIGPCAMPGIMAGWIITVMLTAGSAVTPILPGGKNSGWSTGQICNRFVTRCTGDAVAIFGVLPRAFASRVTWPGLRVTAQSLATTVAEGEAMARAPSYATLRLICRTCGAAVLLYRVAAVLAAGIVAFNDTMFPPHRPGGASPRGSSTATIGKRAGSTATACCGAFGSSSTRGVIVSALAVAAGTCNAVLSVRKEFRFKNALCARLVLALVTPG